MSKRSDIPVPELTALSEAEREEALARYRLLQPYLEGRCTLTQLAEQCQLAYRTAQRWVSRYRRHGLAGLVRQPRRDRSQSRLPAEMEQLIVGLALQKTRPTVATVHRQILSLAPQHGWPAPSYDCVRDVIRAIPQALFKLAYEGDKAYSEAYDLLYRRETARPNEIWQADHSPLDIWLLDEEGGSARPWLTVIEDDYSRSIAGYYLGFQTPDTIVTSLTLRQAIWRKGDPNWHICGIPDVFYTDNGGDFTSRHMEQVSADIKMQLVFSTPGVPRGRGRVERFFRTLNQLLLSKLPGYGPSGKPLTPPELTLSIFQERFHHFLLHEYHERPQRELRGTPRERWEGHGFLPRLPESLEKLDLLLMTVAKTRLVHRDGIRFQTFRYMDVNLAGYVGEEVVIRYDPRDLAEIRVFHQGAFICRAICAELAGREVSLREIIRARRQRSKALKGTIREHEVLVQTFLNVHQLAPEPDSSFEEPPSPPPDEPPKTRLKRYFNE
jgi:putative transposase